MTQPYLWGDTLKAIAEDAQFFTIRDEGSYLTVTGWQPERSHEKLFAGVAFRQTCRWDIEPAKLAETMQLVTEALGRTVPVFEV